MLSEVGLALLWLLLPLSASSCFILMCPVKTDVGGLSALAAGRGTDVVMSAQSSSSSDVYLISDPKVDRKSVV